MPEPTNAGAANEEGLESLARLEDRILETVEQLRAARRERAEAQNDAASLHQQLAASEKRVRELTAEVESLRAERRRIAERLEKLLARIDLLGNE